MKKAKKKKVSARQKELLKALASAKSVDDPKLAKHVKKKTYKP